MMPDELAARVPGGRRIIVSLCYDDGLAEHCDTVAPLLEKHGLRGTFYPHLQSHLLHEVDAWRRLAEAGHEIGNHTVFHPCYHEAGAPTLYNLRHYTPQRWRDEVTLADAVLRSIDGETRRTFGNTCHENRLGERSGLVSIETLAADLFVAARGEHTGRPVQLNPINWFNLGTRGIDGCGFPELRDEIESLCGDGGWWIYTLHGISAREHPLYFAAEAHRQLVAWLGDKSDRVWTAPVKTVAEVFRGRQTPVGGSVARSSPSTSLRP